MSGFTIEDFKFDYSMDRSKIEEDVETPLFVEGLLGVGHVGLLSENHLLRELEFEKAAKVYSPHFSEPFQPKDTPGVVYSEKGTAKLHYNELFYNPENDLFVYKGLYQGDYCEYYYRHANLMIGFCNDLGVGRVYTLGGLGMGSEVEESNTRAIVTSEERVARIGPHAEIQRGKENRPGVTGLSGLLIGMSEKNGIEGVSLLGETHGSYPDAKAAKTVLDSLCEIENIEIDLSGLDEKAEELEKKKEEFKRKMKAIRGRVRGRGGEERGDRRYVG
ncbi:hypothetical protein AKJ57_03800 [candidate division MSBL1 archaeon SCGC-AAA259A05]|uniref:PAC2 family protein n=1 Tax=candidate division MSBL1 archaeon SCGC-AAA259A05 TaxID=1698259 RepID=A0A133U9D8_9EURY|nr:hypothetical protein AKJ57_03800 [candidate division MSBL1 archaeon SCGC-AAA259A05]